MLALKNVNLDSGSPSSSMQLALQIQTAEERFGQIEREIGEMCSKYLKVGKEIGKLRDEIQAMKGQATNNGAEKQVGFKFIIFRELIFDFKNFFIIIF